MRWVGQELIARRRVPSLIDSGIHKSVINGTKRRPWFFVSERITGISSKKITIGKPGRQCRGKERRNVHGSKSC